MIIGNLSSQLMSGILILENGDILIAILRMSDVNYEEKMYKKISCII